MNLTKRMEVMRYYLFYNYFIMKIYECKKCKRITAILYKKKYCYECSIKVPDAIRSGVAMECPRC